MSQFAGTDRVSGSMDLERGNGDMTSTQSRDDRQDLTHPGAELGPGERLVAVAEILARGVRRALAASARSERHPDREPERLQPPVNTEKPTLPWGPGRALMSDEETS
jgi:hypothetical protein